MALSAPLSGDSFSDFSFDGFNSSENTGQMLCRMFLSWDLSVFVMITPGLCYFWRKTTEVKYHFCHIISGYILSTGLITGDSHWLRLFLGNTYFYSLHLFLLHFLQVSYIPLILTAYVCSLHFPDSDLLSWLMDALSNDNCFLSDLHFWRPRSLQGPDVLYRWNLML